MSRRRQSPLLEIYRDGVPHRKIRASKASLALSMAALANLSLGRFFWFKQSG